MHCRANSPQGKGCQPDAQPVSGQNDNGNKRWPDAQGTPQGKAYEMRIIVPAAGHQIAADHEKHKHCKAAQRMYAQYQWFELAYEGMVVADENREGRHNSNGIEIVGVGNRAGKAAGA